MGVAYGEKFLFHGIQLLVFRPIIFEISDVSTNQGIGRNKFCFKVGERIDAEIGLRAVEVDILLFTNERDEEAKLAYQHSDGLYVNTIHTVLYDIQFKLIAVNRIVVKYFYDVNNAQ